MVPANKECETTSVPTPSSSARLQGDDHAPDRALPQWAIDALLFGMPRLTPAPKLWGKAVSIAMCMQRRGWSEAEYISEFMSRTMRKNEAGQKRYTNHALWEQIQAYSKHGNSGLHEIQKAWEAAKINLLNGEGLTTPDELINNAMERAWAWEVRLDEGRDDLSRAQALVMFYVISEVERRQMTRVVCPCRKVGEFAKVPHSTASRALQSLTDKGLLIQFSNGSYSKNPAFRKAAIYSLGDPFTLRVGGRGGLSDKPGAFRKQATID